MNCSKNGPGVTHALDNQKTYSPAKAGVLLVWKDPADGKIYVVNGRHRHKLAVRTGQPHVLVMKVNAPTAEEARVIGAETNISEGHGSAVDAARHFKSAKIRTLQDAARRGLPLDQPNVAKGLAMARLRGETLDGVERGEIPEGRAVAVGRAAENPAHQDRTFRAIYQIERRGRKVTDGQAESIAQQIAEGGAPSAQARGHAGPEDAHTLLGEQAEIDDYVLGQIRKGRGMETSRGAGIRKGVERANGPKIAPEESVAILSQPSSGLEQLYTRVINKPGVLNNIRATAAQKLARREESPLKIKGDACFRIRRELQKQLGDKQGARNPLQK